MPQLPSGIHIAVDTIPLSELLETWHLDASRQALGALEVKEDLLPLTRIVELVPAGADAKPLQLLAGSATPPQNMTTRDTGKRLSQCPDGLPEWSEADKHAFRAFVAERVPSILDRHFTIAKEENARRHQDFVRRLEEAWMQAGVHPSQEPGWNDWPDNPNIDVYDELIALLQCRDVIRLAGADLAASGPAVDRLEGFLSMAASTLTWLPKAGLPDVPTDAIASALRRAVEPGAFEEDRRNWWTSQVAIECNNLFNEPALESFLMARAPKAYGVIRLCAISKGEELPL